MLHVDFDFSGIDAELDNLAAVAESAVRPSAQAGAQVFYDEVLRRVPVSKSVRKVKGKTFKPGALKAAIYQAYSEDNSDATLATYHVSWNAKKAPHGHLVEGGTSRTPAHPFIRPSFDAVQSQALQASEEKIVSIIGDKLK